MADLTMGDVIPLIVAANFICEHPQARALFGKWVRWEGTQLGRENVMHATDQDIVEQLRDSMIKIMETVPMDVVDGEVVEEIECPPVPE